jgi:hypothetical protein
MAFVNRENEIFRMLNGLAEEEVDFVVVGGYAVSGLGKHRFSVDCDVVISKTELEDTETVLERWGYENDVGKKGFDETYSGEFVRYKKKVGELPVTFDLLVGSLVCRTTGASWSFDYIKKHAVKTNIGGIEATAKCSVPEKELMIAFKIHSARRTDVRDIVMLIENSDVDKVLTHLRRGKIEVLKKQVNDIIEMLNDEKLVDSLKGVFTLTIDVRKQIVNARKKMENLSKELS